MLQSSLQGPKDIEITPAPSDGISDLSFSPTQDLLASSSWDNQTRVWEIQQNGSTIPKASVSHDGPALCCTFSKDGTRVISGGADKVVKIFDIASSQTMTLQGHSAPIKSCRWFENILVTGSWDKTIKYWDLRSANPVASVALPERVLSMDIFYPNLVVATAERHIIVFNLTNPTQPQSNLVSPLKYQTRVVSCFADGKGYAVGSVEGRVGIQYFDDKSNTANNFSFKCHRVGNDIYSVNAISFHPLYGTFSTAGTKLNQIKSTGADGTYSFWDKDSKQRLKNVTAMGAPISATAFNRNGTIFAYTQSYDWSKGHEHYQQGAKNQIFLHPVKDQDIKPKAGVKKR